MRNDWLCKCKHSLEDHTFRSREYDGTPSEFVSGCHHDKAYFKDMCSCYWYRPMSNLEYLEQEYEHRLAL